MENLRRVLAIELITATRAIDMRTSMSNGVLLPGPAGAAVLGVLRQVVPGPGPDRFLAPELAEADLLVGSGAIRAAAETATGPLH